MNVNQMAEKAIAERMGVLLLENAKLQALLAASNAQVETLRKMIYDPKPAERDGDGEVIPMAD